MHKAERHALYTSTLVPAVGVAVAVDAAWPLVPLLIVLCPIAVLWLVWVVLHDKEAPLPDLIPGHEWDYLDRPDLMERDAEADQAPLPERRLLIPKRRVRS
jgi:hypothetical protein